MGGHHQVFCEVWFGNILCSETPVQREQAKTSFNHALFPSTTPDFILTQQQAMHHCGTLVQFANLQNGHEASFPLHKWKLSSSMLLWSMKTGDC